MHEGENRSRTGKDGFDDLRDLRRRLESLRVRLAQREEAGPEEGRRILKERARLLSEENRGARDDLEVLHVVEFLLSGERYGVELPSVREVYPMREFTPVPCTPPFVVGLINIRGRVLSVIDIRKFFDLPEKGLTNLNRVIVLGADRMEFGILADAILGVRSVPLKDLQRSLPTLSGIRSDYFKGVAGDRLIVLDAARIVTDKRLVVHEEVEG